MFSDERRRQIADILETQRFVHVADLANRFFTSEATIRRDLDKLRKSGLLKRTYGGAVCLEGMDSEIPLAVREEERRAQKERIAQTAAQLIQMDAVMIIDSSSTCAKLLPYLAARKPKTVITNSPKTAIQLAQCGVTHIYSTGGYLRRSSLSYVGEAARNMIASYYVDILFFSCRGASIDLGLTDPSEEEAELKRVMVAHSKLRVLMLDSSKFGQQCFARLGDFSGIDYLITEQKLSDEWARHLEKFGVTVMYPT
jgi:DeoR/GlpR family transcriptional regulator of sugar metabolism